MSSPSRILFIGSPTNPQSLKRETNTSKVTIDAGSRSASLAIAMERSLLLEQKLTQEADTSSPDLALQRMLSLRSVVSTTSSFAERQQFAVGKVSGFREIEKGSIGVIFEHPGTIRCYKLPLLDNSSKLWNNYNIHTGVYEAFQEAQSYVGVAVRIPEMFWFANEKTSGFWGENLSKFPFTNAFPKKPRELLCMERILPLPRPLRHLLIDQYCLGDKDEAKPYQPNQDCLVRPLLGRRRFGSGRVAFSLRNFRLHLDQFEELKLDVGEYVIAMADAMAILHCKAKIDTLDVEFVIGSTSLDMQSSGASVTSASIKKMQPGTSTFELVAAKDFTNREICLWVVDFDACSAIDLNQVGVEAAVKAFMGTEAYCPRPSENSKDQKLWTAFGHRYIATAATLKAHPNFAVGFLKGVEAAVKLAQAGQTTNATVIPPSGRGLVSSSEVSSRDQDRGRGQLGGRSGSSRDKTRSDRDLGANWRK